MTRLQSPSVGHVYIYPIGFVDPCPEPQRRQPKSPQSTREIVLLVDEGRRPRSLWRTIFGSIWRVR